MKKGWKYSVAISEPISTDYPSLLQGDILAMMTKASEIGFDAVELHIESPEELDVDAVCRQKEELGIEISAISSGLAFTQGRLSLFSEDDSVREKARERFRSFIDVCGKLECMLILGLMKGQLLIQSTHEEADSLLEEYLEDVLAYARDRGVTILLEPIHKFLTNYMNTVKQVIDYIDRIQAANFKALIDTYHMYIEEENMIDPLYYAQGNIGNFHVSDSNRRAPGLGQIHFLEMFNSLDIIGYQGYLSVECIPFPSQEESARHSLQYLKAMESAVRLRRKG
ncbi:MAG: sugar phosphate isomerase/epimerase [Sphaerochaetaceae bacterium]|nr:sugar phosphate isomerase/epimerase [Sphaerochaetaceae bacterium]